MAIEPGKIVCQGSHLKPDGNNCPVCHEEIVVAQSNGGRIMTHTRS